MFRLEKLIVNDHPQLGELELFFTDHQDQNKSTHPYVSVLIGPNGTGKSYVLRTIIDAFRELYHLKESGRREKFVLGHFLIMYLIDDVHYSFGNLNPSFYNEVFNFSQSIVPGGKSWRQSHYKYFIHRNGKEVKPAEIIIPERLLANSMMLTDKFLFLSKPEDFEIYKYLGIRATRSSAGTRSYIKNTIKYLANSTSKELIKRKLNDLLSFLQLQHYLVLRYYPRRQKLFFTGNLTVEHFNAFLRHKEEEHLIKKNKASDKEIIPWFSLKKFQSIAQDKSKLKKLIDFCNLKARELSQSETSKKVFFQYDLIENLQKLERDIQMINLLEELNLLNPPELRFKKESSNDYGFDGASSGESHFITAAIGILSNIKTDSIVLIDEPEISLHPNWQMKYLHFLRSVYDEFKNCHFIIATHSHFLISDLKGDNSKIIGLKRENGEIETVDLPPNLNTFGWSAEEVLLKVFNAVTSRNYFVAEKLGLMLDFIAREDSNKESIKNKFYELELDHIDGLSDEDPLKMVFDTIVKEYVT